jgi:hypothetical protein
MMLVVAPEAPSPLQKELALIQPRAVAQIFVKDILMHMAACVVKLGHSY